MQRLMLAAGWLVVILGALAGAIFFVALFVIAIRSVPAGHEGDLGTWAGAIFTGLAFGGTIWIASASGRERRAQEKNLAMLTLAGLEPRFRMLQTHIELLQFAISDGSIGERGAPWREHMRRDLSRIGLWKAEDLVALTCLPHRLSVRLATAAANVEECLVFLSSDDSYYLASSTILGNLVLEHANFIHAALTEAIALHRER